MARYDSRGSLDTSLESSRVLTITAGGRGDYFASSLVLQSDSRIVVRITDATGAKFTVAMVTAAGALDTAFAQRSPFGKINRKSFKFPSFVPGRAVLPNSSKQILQNLFDRYQTVS